MCATAELWPTPAALVAWLQQKGVEMAPWGTGSAKSADHLWDELQRGETILLPNPVRRRVASVMVFVWQGEILLHETAQQLPDGRERPRLWPPSEKILPHENYLQAAVRGLCEELALTPAHIQLAPHTHHQHHYQRDSASYPGLLAEYIMHTLEATIPSLPHTAFHTAETTPTGPRRHEWAWLPPTAALAPYLSVRPPTNR